MKILYAIQGTGNGHITVALEVLPYLMQKGEVDILISGTEVDVVLPFPVKYRFNGLCFVFGKKGGIDYLETYKKARLKKFFNEIISLSIDEYDLIFSDFEPVSAWACYLKGKPCIGFSHQAAVASKESPKPKRNDLIGQAVLKYYAPTSITYGFHFLPYSKNIFTPIIRSQLREAKAKQDNHITVYLPAYSEKRLLKLLSYFPDQQWQVFSKRRKEFFQQDNISLFPVTNEAFINSMVSAKGVFCGAGFQTPSEAIFLKKKLLVIPMKGQYEQQCNAVALKMLGVPVLKNVKPKQYRKLKSWIESDAKVSLDFPNETAFLIQEIINEQLMQKQMVKPPKASISKASQFRSFILKKIFYQIGA